MEMERSEAGSRGGVRESQRGGVSQGSTASCPLPSAQCPVPTVDCTTGNCKRPGLEATLAKGMIATAIRGLPSDSKPRGMGQESRGCGVCWLLAAGCDSACPPEACVIFPPHYWLRLCLLPASTEDDDNIPRQYPVTLLGDGGSTKEKNPCDM